MLVFGIIAQCFREGETNAFEAVHTTLEGPRVIETAKSLVAAQHIFENRLGKVYRRATLAIRSS